MTALGKGSLSSSSREDGQKPWMVKMQSPRVQCCLCACCVLSALLGMSMLSVGVCLVLNYNLLDVDTSGLPSNLQNEEGKKVVGIILINMGVVSVVLSGVVSALYFTICSHRSPHASVSPKGKGPHPAPSDGEKGGSSQGAGPSNDRGTQGRPSSRESLGGQPSHLHHHHYKHLHGNGSAAGRNSPNTRRSSGSLPYGRGSGAGPNVPGDTLNRLQASLGSDGPTFKVPRGQHQAAPSPSSSRSHHRRGKKGRTLAGRHYKNPLAPHPEEAGAESQSLSESRRSASSSHSRRLQGVVNLGADLEDELEMTQGSMASGSSDASSHVSSSFIIKVDPCQAAENASPSCQDRETEFTMGDTPQTVDSSEILSSKDKLDNYYEDDVSDEVESGRMSRSTTDSLDLTEEMAEETQAAHRRQDSHTLELIDS